MTGKAGMFVGETYPTSNGPVYIKEYKGRNEVTAVFEDGTEVIARAGHIRLGCLKNPNRPNIFGVGFTGKGDYTPTISGKITKEYETWRGMLRRCYGNDQQKHPTYADCTAEERWHSFQNFAQDYSELVYKHKDWHLDKDLLFKGNKLYSRQTCVMLPPELNVLLIKATAARGPNPIGVCYNRRMGKYGAYVQTGANTFLGYHLTALDAFSAYKQAKEVYIKQQANKWQSQIDPRAYEALMNYQVEITD